MSQSVGRQFRNSQGSRASARTVDSRYEDYRSYDELARAEALADDVRRVRPRTVTEKVVEGVRVLMETVTEAAKSSGGHPGVGP